MTPPEQIAAQLDATWAGWAILYGRYSRQYVAFPAAALHVPAEHADLITAKDPIELERRMRSSTGASLQSWTTTPES